MNETIQNIPNYFSKGKDTISKSIFATSRIEARKNLDIKTQAKKTELLFSRISYIKLLVFNHHYRTIVLIILFGRRVFLYIQLQQNLIVKLNF